MTLHASKIILGLVNVREFALVRLSLFILHVAGNCVFFERLVK